MKPQEQKYIVVSLEPIQEKLEALGAVKSAGGTSTHYYTRQPSNDVVKLVAHDGHAVIHKLQEHGGNFDLVENTSVSDIDAGLQELRKQGYDSLDVVHMSHTDFTYKVGIVGLYTINDFLHSVILTYPEGKHGTIEAELGLQAAEQLKIPYNKYLEKLGKVQTLGIEA